MLFIYDAEHLAIVEAVGSLDASRSHFEAQKCMESGTPGRVLEDGWCNRALQRAGADESPVRALAFGVSLPQALLGRVPSVAIISMRFASKRLESSLQPLEFVVSAVRALKADVHAAYWLAAALGNIGEPLYLKLDPTGYPATSDKWLTSVSLLERLRFAWKLNKILRVHVDLNCDWQNPGDAFPALSRQLFPQEKVSTSTRDAILGAHAPFTPARMMALLVGSPEFQRH